MSEKVAFEIDLAERTVAMHKTLIEGGVDKYAAQSIVSAWAHAEIDREYRGDIDVEIDWADHRLA